MQISMNYTTRQKLNKNPAHAPTDLENCRALFTLLMSINDSRFPIRQAEPAITVQAERKTQRGKWEEMGLYNLMYINTDQIIQQVTVSYTANTGPHSVT